ncbi:MAG: hypothetical protein FJ095_17540 [Deltaproteobacteria bacterium]|nr:hypothetical protein [Deltaproteobacteria bacterium]
MFESIYGSPYHHPYFFWAAGLPVLVGLLAWARLGSHRIVHLRWLLPLFQVAILLDAWLTAPTSPLAGTVAQNVAIAFVVLGDARYFLLLEHLGKGRPLARASAYALAWSLLIPVASLVAKLYSTQRRVIFLTYESMFAVLALGLALVVVPRLPEGPGRTYLRWLTWFEVVQYVTWASADVLILAGFDAGYLLRLVPNAMYYVVFVPFAWRVRPLALDAATGH